MGQWKPEGRPQESDGLHQAGTPTVDTIAWPSVHHLLPGSQPHGWHSAHCHQALGSLQDKAEEGSGISSLLTQDLGLQERLASTWTSGATMLAISWLWALDSRFLNIPDRPLSSAYSSVKGPGF